MTYPRPRHRSSLIHVSLLQANTRKKVHEFLKHHTAYELIPESGKVVVIDIDFSVRQAFHALHEQSISSAPLWDNQEMTIMGMISASDFIQTLKWLRQTVSTGSNPLSEAEMDMHTIRIMRDEAMLEGRELKPLAYVKPTDNFHVVRSSDFCWSVLSAESLTCMTVFCQLVAKCWRTPGCEGLCTQYT